MIRSKVLTILASMLLVLAGAMIINYTGVPVNVHAQQGYTGATAVPGFFTQAVNAAAFQPSTTTGAAGTVTNPASNFLMQVDGGPVFCAGGDGAMVESNIQLAANNTYLIVYNCSSSSTYAKTAVVGPGTSPTTGLPNTILAPIFGVEVPLATVVCNATACGNGGNGSITDSRSAANFPNGKQLSKIAFASLNASAPDGAMVICTSCAVAVGGVSAVCTSGAVINLAVRENGAWLCR